MKPNIIFVAIIALTLVTGCETMKKCGNKCDEKTYDQVLQYDRPYDYVYMKTYDALNSIPNWTPEETDKDRGIIVMRDTQYGSAFDRDKATIKFLVKRISRKVTTVSIDPEFQKVPDSGKMLDAVEQIMKIVKRGEEKVPAPTDAASSVVAAPVVTAIAPAAPPAPAPAAAPVAQTTDASAAPVVAAQ